jgi:hypothetical protein
MQVQITVFLDDKWGAEQCYAEGGIQALEDLCREDIHALLDGAVFEVIPPVVLVETDIV